MLYEKLGAQASDIVVEKMRNVENVILRKQGSSEGLIVIRAHYDKASVGCDAVDNWSGIVSMVHVYKSLGNFPANRSLLFVAFGKEEKGRVGSKAMVEAIDKAQSQQYCAMINFDSLGLGAPQVPLPYPVSYIYCKKAAMGIFDRFVPLAKAEGWDYHEVPLTHAGPAVAPEESAELLMRIASTCGAGLRDHVPDEDGRRHR